MNLKRCGVVSVVAILSFTGCLLAQEVKPAVDSPLTISQVTFSGPTEVFPHYHLAISLRWQGAAPAWVTHIKMGGRRLPTEPVAIEPFAVYVNGRQLVADSKKKLVPPGTKILVRVHHKWTPAKKARLEVTVKPKGGKPVTASLVTTAPREGGFPLPGWRNVKVLVLSEEAGIKRTGEPVDVCLQFEADAMTVPARDIRVFKLNGPVGKTEPVAFQPYDLRIWKGPGRHQHASVCRLVFRADVPAKGKILYAVCYGPPAGDKTPAALVKTDLKVLGKGLALTIKNSFYQVALSKTGGQIEDVVQAGSPFGLGDAKRRYHCWHWGPDIRPIEGRWCYAHAWNPPEHVEKTQGPLFFEIRRRGPLPGLPKVKLEVTYRFYAGVPYIVMSSRFWTVGDVPLINMRQDGISYGPRFTHLAWQAENGKTKTMPLELRGGILRNYVAQLPYNVPWLGCYNKKNGEGYASVRLKSVNLGPDGKQAVMVYPRTFVLKDHWMRCIIMGYWHRYSADDNLAKYPTAIIPKGSQYIDSNAHVFFRYTSEKGLDEIVNWAKRLRTPLRVKYAPYGSEQTRK